MDFTGREANDDADSQLKHYVAVVDPVSKTWEFVEARRLTLRGAVRRAPSADEEQEESEDEEQVCFPFHSKFVYQLRIGGRDANDDISTENHA